MVCKRDDILLRPIREDDFPGVMRVQAEYYAGRFLEPEDTLHARWLDSPDTAWVAEDATGICSYLFGYRSMLGKVTPLRGLFEVASRPDAIYLHDLAVSRRVAGKKVGSRLVQISWELAKRDGLTWSSLISLAPARKFWEQLGYREHALADPAQIARLAGYAEPVTHMAIALRA